MGKTKTTKTHTMTYIKGSMVYHVSFDNRRIMRMENMGAAMGRKQDMKQFSKEMMKKMGAKKIGTDKVLGYTCNIWDLMGVKQCIYEGLILKIESNIMGLKNTEIATKAEFNISLSKDDFKLPDFPIYDMEGNKLDKSKLDAMDTQAEKKAVKRSKDVTEIINVMAVAAKDAGMKKGQKPTKAQEEAMKDSMMTAMLPRMKQKFLEEEKMMTFAYKCLNKANTLKEANICSKKASEISGEADEPFNEWTPKTKKETLHFLGNFVNKAIPCVKKAQTMQEIKLCMPNQ
jgi:hypothetical protein